MNGNWSVRMIPNRFSTAVCRGVRRAALALALLSGCFACSSESEEQVQKWPVRIRPETADQTVLFYLSGQTLLSYFKNTNIPEIQQAVGDHILYDSRVLVLIQPSTQQSLLIEYSFDYDTQACRADTLRRYTDFRSIRQADIVRVLTDMKELAPANRYGLVLGSHGGGWVPAAYMNLTVNESADDDEEELWALSLQADPRDWLGRLAGADATRWFGEDNRSTTDIATWAAAFEQADVSFEYLVFDACFMSNVETLYELRHAARYIVGSPCEIMGRGMPYAAMLPDLFADEGKEYDLEAFCRHFYEYYAATTSTRQSGCIALTVAGELDALAERMKALNASAQQDPDLGDMQVYEGLSRPLFFDLLQYAERIAGDEAALEEFREQFDRTFPEACRLHTPSFYSGYNGKMNPVEYYSGVTTSAPSTKYPLSYAATAWQTFVAGE